MAFQARRFRRARVFRKQSRLRSMGLRRLAPRFTSRGRLGRTGGFTGMEFKFLDTAWNAVTISSSTDGSGGELQPSSGSTSCISMPAQGDGESNRDGRKYTVRSIFFSGVVDYSALQNQADAIDFSPLFFALVLDTQANGATMVSEQVYVNPATGGSAILPHPLRNLQFSKRYRILATRMVRPSGAYSITDGASTGSLNVMIQPTVKLGWKGAISCLASGTTADVANATDNAFHIVAFTAGTSGTPTFNGKCRVRFTG